MNNEKPFILVLVKRCQNKATCDIYATNSVFGNPCRNSTNVLEVIYSCYDQSIVLKSFIFVCCCLKYEGILESSDDKLKKIIEKKEFF